MSISRQPEPRRLPEEGYRLLDRVAGRIRPDDPALEEWYARYWKQHRRRLAADLWIIEREVADGAAILECGAVPPLMTAALAELGYAVRAVDIAPERFAGAIAELELEVARCDIETEPAPFADASFDAVLFHELFEHLRINPIATFTEIRRVLRPGGVLLLSTPNLRSFRGLRNLLLEHRGSATAADPYREYEKLETLGHMGHVREYTAREVATFLARLEFRVEKIVYRGGHGRGLVGVAERLAPSLRPFFSLIAIRDDGASPR